MDKTTESKESKESKLIRYQNYLNQDPDNVALIMDLVPIYLEHNHLIQARQLLDKLATLALSFNETYQLAVWHLQMGEFPRAIELLASLYAHDQSDKNISFTLSFCYFQIAQYSDALKTFDEGGLDTSPERQHIILKARILHALGEIKNALSILEQNKETAQDDAEFCGIYALLYADFNQLPRALIWTKKALAINPVQQEALLVENYLTLHEQDAQKAYQQAKALIELNSKNARAWINFATAYMLLGDLVKAYQACDQAVSLFPEFIGIWQLKAWCELMQGMLINAKQSFTKAYDLDHNFAESHGGLAIIAVLEADIDLANSYIATAKKLNPHNISGNYAEALLLQAQDPVKAQQKINEIKKHIPGVDQQKFDLLVQQLQSRNNSAKKHLNGAHKTKNVKNQVK
ncbi:tetratricopeptide repeat protein [Cysteiniphilum litorale]|uniref:tetratricopeptide repeat protein n=1 Tax=Cysteiniphilum litorale TaxID=2056700 RepID=UPI003F884E1D